MQRRAVRFKLSVHRWIEGSGWTTLYMKTGTHSLGRKFHVTLQCNMTQLLGKAIAYLVCISRCLSCRRDWLDLTGVLGLTGKQQPWLLASSPRAGLDPACRHILFGLQDAVKKDLKKNI